MEENFYIHYQRFCLLPHTALFSLTLFICIIHKALVSELDSSKEVSSKNETILFWLLSREKQR